MEWDCWEDHINKLLCESMHMCCFLLAADTSFDADGCHRWNSYGFGWVTQAVWSRERRHCFSSTHSPPHPTPDTCSHRMMVSQEVCWCHWYWSILFVHAAACVEFLKSIEHRKHVAISGSWRRRNQLDRTSARGVRNLLSTSATWNEKSGRTVIA